MADRHAGLQTTLKRRVALSGTGVHSGTTVSLALSPAEAGSGISFLRTDIDGDQQILAHVSHVNATDFCTGIGIGGASVSTIEHLMAALRALNVDNAIVEIDGAEVPIMDGSAAAFIEVIEKAGIVALAVPRRYIKVLKPVRVENGSSFAELRPHDGFRLEIDVDFASPLIGRQAFAIDVDGDSFRRDLARARTFGFLADVEQLWARGLALGASLENAVVIGEDRIINPEGLRYADEFVRHKALDAVGDLALAGAPILGRYRSYRGGHKLNVKALQALFADETAWASVELTSRREIGHADLTAASGMPAFGPDVS